MRIERIFMFLAVLVSMTGQAAAWQQGNGTLAVEVRSNSRPVEQVEITIGEQVMVTNSFGEAVFDLPAGKVEIEIRRYGFKARTTEASIAFGETTRLTVDLEAEAVSNEEITVTATRSQTRIEMSRCVLKFS